MHTLAPIIHKNTCFHRYAQSHSSRALGDPLPGPWLTWVVEPRAPGEIQDHGPAPSSSAHRGCQLMSGACRCILGPEEPTQTKLKPIYLLPRDRDRVRAPASAPPLGTSPHLRVGRGVFWSRGKSHHGVRAWKRRLRCCPARCSALSAASSLGKVIAGPHTKPRARQDQPG